MQIEVNGAASESPTAIKIKASGEYLGIVKWIVYTDMTARSYDYFQDVSNDQKLTLG